MSFSSSAHQLTSSFQLSESYSGLLLLEEQPSGSTSPSGLQILSSRPHLLPLSSMRPSLRLALFNSTTVSSFSFSFLLYTLHSSLTDSARLAVPLGHLPSAYCFLSNDSLPGIPGSLNFAQLSGLYTPDRDGDYQFGVTCDGKARIFVDGKLVVDNWDQQTPGE